MRKISLGIHENCCMAAGSPFSLQRSWSGAKTEKKKAYISGYARLYNFPMLFRASTRTWCCHQESTVGLCQQRLDPPSCLGPGRRLRVIGPRWHDVAPFHSQVVSTLCTLLPVLSRQDQRVSDAAFLGRGKLISRFPGLLERNRTFDDVPVLWEIHK